MGADRLAYEALVAEGDLCGEVARVALCHEHDSTVSEDARGLTDSRLLIPKVVEGIHKEHPIEDGVAERHRTRIAEYRDNAVARRGLLSSKRISVEHRHRRG